MMPTYTIYNEETGEEFDIMMKIADKPKFLSQNPHFRQIVTAPAISKGGVNDRVKPDGGFKDVLSRIADANPTSALASDYGKKDKKESAVRDSMQRVRKKLGSISTEGFK
jgi:hypothetical protein|tara:strand:+ start:428 stop:757 length:330 start_codon:yes stop_codon:yes gene_type:complete